MAVAVPGAFLTNVQQMRAREDAEVKPFRLPTNHLTDLRDVARGIEETNVGIACKYLVDHTLVGGNADIDDDGYVNHLDAIEKFCDQYSVWKLATVDTWRRRIARCRRALALMHRAGDHKAVGVLHVVYGYPDPVIRTFAKKVQDTLGELAPLARYTDIVEVRRQEMARAEAVKMDERAAQATHAREVREALYPPPKKGVIQEILDAAAARQEERAIAIRHGYPVTTASHLQLEFRRREYYQWALNAISSTDALRAQLFVPTEREDDETKEQFQERRDVAEARRDAFVSQVKIESERMLSTASKKYHASWLASR